LNEQIEAERASKNEKRDPVSNPVSLGSIIPFPRVLPTAEIPAIGLNGVRDVLVVEQPDAIKSVLVRWKGVKLDLAKLAKLRWIENKKLPELCQVFGLRRTAINRSLRTLRNSGLSELNLTDEERKVIQKQLKEEKQKYGDQYR
jgi:hypothetical protein